MIFPSVKSDQTFDPTSNPTTDQTSDPTSDPTSNPTSDPTSKSLLVGFRLMHCSLRFISLWYLKSCSAKPEHIHCYVEAVDWCPGEEEDEADRGQDPELDFVGFVVNVSYLWDICWGSEGKIIVNYLELTCWSFFSLQSFSQFAEMRQVLLS